MSGRRQTAAAVRFAGARRQQPLQMLKLPSLDLLRARAGAREEERRNSVRSETAARRLIFARGATAGEPREETMGAAEGTVGTVMFGGGGGEILPALPIPLGSLTELLRPPALPGPRMPLTPASWARRKAPSHWLPGPRQKMSICRTWLHSSERVANESRGLAFRFHAWRRRRSREWSRSRCRPRLAPSRRSEKC